MDPENTGLPWKCPALCMGRVMALASPLLALGSRPGWKQLSHQPYKFSAPCFFLE